MPLLKHLLRSIKKTIKSIKEILDFFPTKALEYKVIFLNKLKAIFYNLYSLITFLVSIYYFLFSL